jgi:hypothetical protein
MPDPIVRLFAVRSALMIALPVTPKLVIVAVDVLLDTVIILLKALWLLVDIVRMDPLAPVPRFGSAWLSPKNSWRELVRSLYGVTTTLPLNSLDPLAIFYDPVTNVSK